jgi:hypothetical protein
MDQVYIRKISWFTVVISDSVLQWKPIFLKCLKHIKIIIYEVEVCKNKYTFRLIFAFNAK